MKTCKSASKELTLYFRSRNSNLQALIHRNLHTKILEYQNIFPVVAILGPRQCGKSTLAEMILRGDDSYIYLDLEKDSDLNKLHDPELFFRMNREKNICIDENTRYLLFRSIRELMHNVVKHAQATKLDVNFCINNGSLEITVRDNGIGFDYNPDQLRLKSDSYGLFSIYERLSDLDGSLVVNSIIGKGSNIKLAIPLKDE